MEDTNRLKPQDPREDEPSVLATLRELYGEGIEEWKKAQWPDLPPPPAEDPNPIPSGSVND
jgi:hypothetical protein